MLGSWLSGTTAPETYLKGFGSLRLVLGKEIYSCRSSNTTSNIKNLVSIFNPNLRGKVVLVSGNGLIEWFTIGLNYVISVLDSLRWEKGHTKRQKWNDWPHPYS
jgi:hypothetical protein